MANNTSQHILSTAANLVGFCLFVITSIHIANKSEASLIDEIASVIAVMLIFSTISSFVSIRTKNEKREYYFEKTADALFFLSLLGILFIIGLISLKFV